jgi:hypothetical protein
MARYEDDFPDSSGCGRTTSVKSYTCRAARQPGFFTRAVPIAMNSTDWIGGERAFTVPHDLCVDRSTYLNLVMSGLSGGRAGWIR